MPLLDWYVSYKDADGKPKGKTLALWVMFMWYSVCFDFHYSLDR